METRNETMPGHIINGVEIVYSPRMLQPGDIIDTWCHRCGHATAHRYQPQAWPPLVCLGPVCGQTQEVTR